MNDYTKLLDICNTINTKIYEYIDKHSTWKPGEANDLRSDIKSYIFTFYTTYEKFEHKYKQFERDVIRIASLYNLLTDLIMHPDHKKFIKQINNIAIDINEMIRGCNEHSWGARIDTLDLSILIDNIS